MTLSSRVSEQITAETGDPDAWHCICGNQPCENGFYPCDSTGRDVEPDLGGGWTNLYVCAQCGRIINADTLDVVRVKSV